MKYDKDYQKVIKLLDSDYGWDIPDIKALSKLQKEFTNDVIKATKRIQKK